MGGNGKPKQVQRTKNNEKPSNSGRSAELLGNSIPSLVTLSTGSNFLTSGAVLGDKLPECFDPSINSQYQLILRKMGKKDPVTKIKALHSFTELIMQSELDVVKTILPVWPKYYDSLSNDTDHRVREFAQKTHNVIVTKVGKFIAPHLKQLSPVWLSSQYDSYPPVSSIAISSFKAAFPPDKVEKVCLFCETEILDYVIRNITFHTPTTLASNSTCTPDEMEHKYQRIVVSSFKTFAFFIKQVHQNIDNVIQEKCSNLFENQKFWNFSKHRNSAIRASWFEMVYTVLHYKSDLIVNHEQRLIQIISKSIDDTHSVVLSYVWQCILSIQTAYKDWIDHINVKNTIIMKLESIFKNEANGNLAIICPNLLPFISNIYGKNLKDITPIEFYEEFFNMIKQSITTVCTLKSKSEFSAVVSSYFECIRYIVLKMSQDTNTENINNNTKFVKQLLHDHIIDVIKWSLMATTSMTKLIHLHMSALIAFWTNSSSLLYSELSREFWSNLYLLITETLSIEYVNEQCLARIVELVNNLFNANPNLQENKVQFIVNKDVDKKEICIDKGENESLAFIATDLKQLVIQVSRLCLVRAEKEKSVKYLDYMNNTSKLFADRDFYERISDGDLLTTLKILKTFLSDEYKTTETVIDVIFSIVNFVDKTEQTKCFNDLLSVTNDSIIYWTLERMLSYPLCVLPETHQILSQKFVSDKILKIAEGVISMNSKENLNLLHKCFFVTDTGDMLILRATADEILNILTRPLTDKKLIHMIDVCGSFVSQVMSISPNEATFLKLYKFSIDSVENDYLSPDTLWEITTCWQDALSSLDITMNDELLGKCVKILSKRLFCSDYLTADEILNIAEMISKLVICSTENIKEEDICFKTIESMFDTIVQELDACSMSTYNSLAEFCLLLEMIEGKTSGVQLGSSNINYASVHNLITKNLFNTSLFPKLIIPNANLLELDEIESYEEFKLPKTWSNNMYNIIIESMKVCSIGESLVVNSYLITDEDLTSIFKLSEEIKKVLLNTTADQASEIKRKIFTLIKEHDFPACRALPLVVSTADYKEYHENAMIVLLEDISEYLLKNDSMVAYMNSLQTILPFVSSKAITIPNKSFETSDNMLFHIGTIRCLILNYFRDNSNNITDHEIVTKAIGLIKTFGSPADSTKHDFLLYNTDISTANMLNVVTVVEFINVLIEILNRFPMEMDITHWDVIRISLSSWALSISKSIAHIFVPTVIIFVPAVYRLFAALTKFITNEKTKSSTIHLTKVIDEWQNLFEREVHLVLFDNFVKTVHHKKPIEQKFIYEAILGHMGTSIECLDFSIIFNSYNCTNLTKINDLIQFTISNLVNPIQNVKCSAMFILKKICPFFINMDSKIIEQKETNLDRYDDISETSWHFLNNFRSCIEEYNELIRPYTEEFSFKPVDICCFQPIDKHVAINCFIIWDCIIFICHSSPAELRSIYAKWLHDNKYEQNVLNFLIRSMPVEILKNHDKIMNNNIFKGLTWSELKDRNLSIEGYSCHLYMEILRGLPVVVRKWWNLLPSRQKTFVDKLTTNYASNILCQEELDAISSKIEKQTNIQVKIHTSTREVQASYIIDEARMEIGIILSPNYPLGSVKVEIGKQIGGRASWRNVGMQLTIFLTHQNGSIFDGLSLWKKNLDKKFEGVEECYICYSVIHQDTCQFPKLTCSTCRKKFHGPCLYKWFTTSNKSTCPICRNIF